MASTTSLKQTFNPIAYEVVTYLESLDHVDDVIFKAHPGHWQQDLIEWEKANVPYKLPKDLKSFYQLFDGISLTWSVKCAGRNIPTGCLRIQPLKEMMRIPLNGLDSIELQRKYKQAYGGRGKKEEHVHETTLSSFAFAAFVLDSHPRYGKVAIILPSPSTSSSCSTLSHLIGDADDHAAGGVLNDYGVWLVKDRDHHRGLSSKASSSSSLGGNSSRSAAKGGGGGGGGGEQWHHICASFKDYMRLMTVHLGIQGWQNAYAPTGLDSVTKQWMRLYCPERLTIDEIMMKQKKEEEEEEEEDDGEEKRLLRRMQEMHSRSKKLED